MVGSPLFVRMASKLNQPTYQPKFVACVPSTPTGDPRGLRRTHHRPPRRAMHPVLHLESNSSRHTRKVRTMPATQADLRFSIVGSQLRSTQEQVPMSRSRAKGCRSRPALALLLPIARQFSGSANVHTWFDENGAERDVTQGDVSEQG